MLDETENVRYEWRPLTVREAGKAAAKRFDRLLQEKHPQGGPKRVGHELRMVVEQDGAWVGLSKGFAKHRGDLYRFHGRPKKLWLRPLGKHAIEHLRAPRLPDQFAAGETASAHGQVPVSQSQLRTLAQALRATPDPRATIGKSGNAELYYEQYKRDIEQDFLGGTDTGEQEENRFIARVNYHASSRAALYAEIGATDSDGSEGAVPLIGAGLKIKVYDSPALNVNAFASATYINEIE